MLIGPTLSHAGEAWTLNKGKKEILPQQKRNVRGKLKEKTNIETNVRQLVGKKPYYNLHGKNNEVVWCSKKRRPFNNKKDLRNVQMK